jgi:hydroxymethylpyrimidine pyrophosphatase-like HAD family hydrolase
MDHLREAGIRVIPVTAASAGWCHLMAHMWPVDAVIGENGGVAYRRGKNGVIRRLSWTANEAESQRALSVLQHRLLAAFPELEAADDDDFRLTCLAFRRLSNPNRNAMVLEKISELGASGTVNSYWLLAWTGPYDKLSASRRLLSEEFGHNVDADQTGILFSGDSENDEPMFAFFRNSVGVSTVAEHALTHRPRWITRGPGGAGFVELAERLLAARRR